MGKVIHPVVSFAEMQVRFSFADSAARLPKALRSRAVPLGEGIDGVLNGTDDRAVSQRIALLAFAVRILSAVIAYFSQVLMARWMGDFEYGIFVVVWVGAVILGGLACLGFQTAVIRFIPEYTERGDSQLLRGVLIGSRVQGFVAATFFAAIGAFGLYEFGDSLTSYYLIPLYLGAVTLPMLAIGEIHEGVSRAFNWADLSLWPTYIVRPLAILLFMWIAIEAGAPSDAVTAMACVIGATYFTSIGQLIWVARRLKKIVPAGPRHYQPKTWVAVALPIFIVDGFFNLLTNVDILIVGHYMEPDDVAIYFAAVKTLALVHFVYFAVRAGSAQRFAQYYASGDQTKLRSFLRDTLHWTFWPSLALVVLLFLTGKYLLMLFGESFVAGYPLLYILSIGLLFRAAIGPAESLLVMAGQQGLCAIIYTGTFVLNVVLNITLVPKYGLSGAASATTVALIAETAALYWIAATRLGIKSSIVAALRSPVAKPAEAG